MKTSDYIQLLIKEYNSQKQDWDEYLKSVDTDRFQEKLNWLPEGETPARQYVNARIKEIREMSPTDLADLDMMRIVDLVKMHLTDKEKSTLKDFHFVQLWTSNLNALATRAPNGDRLVLINRGCMVAFAYASIAFTDSNLNTPYSTLGRFIREDIQLFVFSIEALGLPMKSHNINVTEIQKKVLLADPNKSGFADMLCIAMVSFVVAHELAHHILGHQGKYIPSNRMINGKPLSFYQYSRQNEYEADKYALNIFNRVQTEMSRDIHIGEPFSMSKFCTVAPILAMVLIESAEFLKKARHVTISDKSDTHPCGYERRKALEPLVWDSLDQEQKRFITGVNFFLFKSVPAFFKGFLPDAQSIFVHSPLFDLDAI